MKLNILRKSRYNVDLILVLYTTEVKSTLYRLLLKIFSFSTCFYANQIKPLIQRTPTERLSTVDCFKTLKFNAIFWERIEIRVAAGRHVQSYGLFYMWNHVERPLKRLFRTKKKLFLRGFVNCNHQHIKIFSRLICEKYNKPERLAGRPGNLSHSPEAKC